MLETRTVQLPYLLCEAAEEKYRSQFNNLEELLSFVLKELTNDSALKTDEAELQLVEERLRDLGYL